jgi:hypothetical protein
MTMLLVVVDCATQPRIRDLQGASFLLGEVRVLKRGKNVNEFRFQFLKLCTKHRTSVFLLNRHGDDFQTDVKSDWQERWIPQQKNICRLRSDSCHEFLSSQT